MNKHIASWRTDVCQRLADSHRYHMTQHDPDGPNLPLNQPWCALHSALGASLRISTAFDDQRVHATMRLKVFV